MVIDHKQARSGQQINWEAFDKPNLSDQEAAELGALLKADVVIMGEVNGHPVHQYNGLGDEVF